LAALPHAASQRFGDLIAFLPSTPFFLFACAGALACWRKRRLGALLAFAAMLFLLNLTFHASAPQYFIDIYPALAALCGVGFAASIALLRTCTDPQANRDAQLFAAAASIAALAGYLPLFDGGLAPAAVLLFAASTGLGTWAISGARRYPL